MYTICMSSHLKMSCQEIKWRDFNHSCSPIFTAATALRPAISSTPSGTGGGKGRDKALGAKMRQLRSPRVFMAKRDKKLRMNHASQLQLRYRFSIYPHIKMDLSLNTCPIYASKMDMFQFPERQDDFPKTTRAFSMSGRLPLPLPFGFSCGVIVMTRDDQRDGEGFKKRTNKSNLKCPGPENQKKTQNMEMGNWRASMEFRAGSFLLTHFQHKQSANLRWHFFTQPEQSRSILSLSLPFLLILGKRNKDLKCGALVTWKRQSCFTVLRFLKKTHADFKLFHVGNNHSSSTEGPADVQVLRNGPGWAWEKLI